ncbi:MAG TPA: outer membrane beta-barrel protein [Brumimicrobium sp.]|nr:outer membrane beta-barrel protein [Brumimicrobium sp.]
MKALLSFFLCAFLSINAFAQDLSHSSQGKIKFNWFRTGVFIDGNAGIRLLGETSSQADMDPGLTLNAGMGYFFNKKVGMKGRIDYHQFPMTRGNGSSTSYSVGLSLEAVANLLQVFGPEKARKFSFLAHGGAGLTSLINPEFKKHYEEVLGKEFNDPLIKGGDEMFHIILGVTPQYHFKSKFSLNLDISQFIQFNQHRTYDTFSAELAKTATGVFGASLGLTIRFD